MIQNGNVVSHGYHSQCLQRCQFICLKYLQGEIKKKVDAVIMSMERGSVEHEPVSESSENAVEDDLNNVEEVTELLEHAF